MSLETYVATNKLYVGLLKVHFSSFFRQTNERCCSWASASSPEF